MPIRDRVWEGGRKSAQMCKKLNSKRLHGAASVENHFICSATSRRGVAIAMCLLMETSITNHLPNESVRLPLDGWWCDNGKVNDNKWIWRLPSIIFKRLSALTFFPFVSPSAIASNDEKGFQIFPPEDSIESSEFIATCLLSDSSLQPEATSSGELHNVCLM